MMISKELFVSIISLIQAQDSINAAVSASLEMICEKDNIRYGENNNYRKALLILLSQIFDDKEDFISWWLYYSEDHIVAKEVNGKDEDWTIDTPEQLYNFLVEERNYRLKHQGEENEDE